YTKAGNERLTTDCSRGGYLAAPIERVRVLVDEHWVEAPSCRAVLDALHVGLVRGLLELGLGIGLSELGPQPLHLLALGIESLLQFLAVLLAGHLVLSIFAW